MNHAKFAPSSAERHMLCPGAMAMEEGLPDDPSGHTDEGTAGHFLGSECLVWETAAAEYVGQSILVGTRTDFDGAWWLDPAIDPQDAITRVRNTYVVDDEMAGHVQTYIDAVKFFASTCAGSTLMVEQRMPIEHYTGEAGACGTADAVVIAGDELQMHDLKYGFKRVYAKKNKQLMIYALAALLQFEMLADFKRVTLVIHQPRVDDTPDEWSCSVEDLLAFGEEVKAAAFHSFACLTEKPGALIHHLRPSPEACLWCKAKAICPALAKHVTDAVTAEFEDLSAVPEKQHAAKAESLVPDDAELLAAKHSSCDLIETWIKAVRARVSEKLFAGEEVPGYKLVQGKRGNRAWTDEAVVDKALQGMGLKAAERYTYNLITPTTAEKVFGPKGTMPNEKRWTRLQLMYAQPGGKPSVAPMHDKRPALVMTTPADFDDLSGGDLA